MNSIIFFLLAKGIVNLSLFIFKILFQRFFRFRFSFNKQMLSIYPIGSQFRYKFIEIAIVEDHIQSFIHILQKISILYCYFLSYFFLQSVVQVGCILSDQNIKINQKWMHLRKISSNSKNNIYKRNSFTNDIHQRIYLGFRSLNIDMQKVSFIKITLVWSDELLYQNLIHRSEKVLVQTNLIKKLMNLLGAIGCLQDQTMSQHQPFDIIHDIFT